MSFAEWDVPFLLTSPKGTLKINERQGGTNANKDDTYLLDVTKCHGGIAALRSTSDDVPQGDGAILHRHFKSFYAMTLDMQFWTGVSDDDPSSREPACECDLVRMLDNLMLHVNALVDPSLAALDSGQCRIQSTPSCSVHDRMLNEIKLFTWPQPTIEPPIYSVQFEVQSPFPYAMDVNEQTSAIDASEIIVNGGTADFYPVFKVHGPCTTFSLTNFTSGFAIDYDGARPGAAGIASGHYAEIGTFHNTIFLDGSGANLMAGVDVTSSEFWKLLVGPNDLSFVSDGSATCEMLWNVAWA